MLTAHPSKQSSGAAPPQLQIANQIAAFNFGGMLAVIYLKLHKAESTLIGGGGGSIKTPSPWAL